LRLRAEAYNAAGSHPTEDATGETSWSGNGYRGKMQMAGKMGGEQMDMTMTHSGHRVGKCASTVG
jgi:hypothetical protein